MPAGGVEARDSVSRPRRARPDGDSLLASLVRALRARTFPSRGGPLLLALGIVVLGACTATVRSGSVASTRYVRADGLCENAYTLVRPPGGDWDRVGIRRLAPCEARDADAPVMLYLPGMHMNGVLADDASAVDVRRELARAGIRVWSVDYRTHVVPDDADPDALEALGSWTADVFADDAEAAAAIARTIDRGPFFVAGFSYGAGIAYRLAARGAPLAGLVILDGTPPHDGASDDRAPEAALPVIDVGGSRLPYAERRRLLAAVLADPASPSPMPGYVTAGEALADVVFTARSFGGAGGLSAAKSGVTDLRSLATLLATYDRWWPRAALGGSTVTPARRVPVLAFASTNMGPAWTSRVRDGAVAFGGPDADVRELPGWGHLDVLVGRDVDRLVAAPIRAFVTQ